MHSTFWGKTMERPGAERTDRLLPSAPKRFSSRPTSLLGRSTRWGWSEGCVSRSTPSIHSSTGPTYSTPNRSSCASIPEGAADTTRRFARPAPGPSSASQLASSPRRVLLRKMRAPPSSGLHVHAGSGILEPEHWERNARALAELAEAIPSVRYVDLGGGLGVPHRFGQPSLDLSALDRSLEGARKMLGGLKIWLEPGRFIVADAGVLLARVTQLKRKDRRLFIGLATGMNSLIRPALYGAHHEIVNLTQLGEAVTELATVVGPICETGDRLGVDRLLPKTREGDVMLIAQVGAYGRVMGSSYNLRLPADEIVIG